MFQVPTAPHWEGKSTRKEVPGARRRGEDELDQGVQPSMELGEQQQATASTTGAGGAAQQAWDPCRDPATDLQGQVPPGPWGPRPWQSCRERRADGPLWGLFPGVLLEETASKQA